jgi:hypothetical protein
MPTGLEGRPPQRRHARHRLRSGDDLQEAAGDAEADPLGLGDGGELVLRVAGDLHGPLQPGAQGPILGLLVGQASPQLLEPGLGRGALDGLDDLLGLAVERLAGLVAVFGHPGDVAVSTAKDGEGAGDTPGGRGHRGLAPSQHIEGSGPRLHTLRSELSTDYAGSKDVLR